MYRQVFLTHHIQNRCRKSVFEGLSLQRSILPSDCDRAWILVFLDKLVVQERAVKGKIAEKKHHCGVTEVKGRASMLSGHITSLTKRCAFQVHCPELLWCIHRIWSWGRLFLFYLRGNKVVFNFYIMLLERDRNTLKEFSVLKLILFYDKTTSSCCKRMVGLWSILKLLLRCLFLPNCWHLLMCH